MAQFPFSHHIEMTYRLSGTTLETRTRITNTGAETRPLSVGYHPYLQLHDSSRDAWRVRLAAASLWNLNDRFTLSGNMSLVRETFPQAGMLTLRGHFLDHVFGDLRRDRDGWARFSVHREHEKLTVAHGIGYPVAVVYAPTDEGQQFLCFEPMSGITNAINLAHRGMYDAFPQVAPSSAWEAIYRISVEGFWGLSWAQLRSSCVAESH